jgi:hypothetical protein
VKVLRVLKGRRRTARCGKSDSKDLLQSLWDEEDKVINPSRSEIGWIQTEHDVPGADKDDIKNIDTSVLKDPGQERKRKEICQSS